MSYVLRALIPEFINLPRSVFDEIEKHGDTFNKTVLSGQLFKLKQ